MSRVDIFEVEKKLINEVDNKVEDNYGLIEELIDSKINEIVSELDSTVLKISTHMNKGLSKLSNDDLQFYTLEVSMKLYSIFEVLEKFGIKSDLSKLMYKDTFNRHYLSIKGTIEDKKQYAELNSNYENIVKTINERCYKIVNGKIERALEIINSLKKILSIRIAEYETTRYTDNIEIGEKRRLRKNNSEGF